MVRKKQIIGIALLFVIVVVGIYGTKLFNDRQKNHNGVPDIVSSSRMNGNEYLTVVANCEDIKNTEAFAREIIHMCQLNAFHAVKFSSMPSTLDISAYLQRKDIGQREPFCKIRFTPSDQRKEYNIKDDSDSYHLYLDDREIAF